MDASSTTTKPPSLHSRASSTTLVPAPDQTQTTSEERYHVYYQRTGPPNPDAKPKSKSVFGKLMSKLPSSGAVQKSVDMRERQLVEEERTGVRRIIVADVTGSATAVALSGSHTSIGHSVRSLGAAVEGKGER